ncbi:DUF4926 domain-containing protein [Microseira sp. BLCC-F43]|uniref:DUF4926 domain-containing protein n=1 Tax=Microseira sp. BLCC-F43 TaxID=3153602 RepID=UPI0035B94E15
MIAELDRVALTTDLPEYSLRTGDIGTVVLVHQEGLGYEVELIALTGQTVAIISLFSSQVRPIGDITRSLICVRQGEKPTRNRVFPKNPVSVRKF